MAVYSSWNVSILQTLILATPFLNGTRISCVFFRSRNENGEPPEVRRRRGSASAYCTYILYVFWRPRYHRMKSLRFSSVRPEALRPHLSMGLPFSKCFDRKSFPNLYYQEICHPKDGHPVLLILSVTTEQTLTSCMVTPVSNVSNLTFCGVCFTLRASHNVKVGFFCTWG